MKRFLFTLVGAVLFLVLAAIPALAQEPWVNGQDAQYVIGQSDFTSASSGTSETKLYRPKEAVINREHGKLYVLDGANNRVLRFAYPITTNMPAAELVFGQPNFAGSGPGTAQNEFNTPYGIAVDDTGRLWVSDYLNNRVVWFDAAHAISSNQPDADGVLGQINFTSNASASSRNGMNHPEGLAVTGDGTLFVADSWNHRVLRFDNAAAKSNGADADGVLGQADFTSYASGLSPSSMYAPRDVAVYGNTLFVADRGNVRVLRFDNVATKSNGADADGVLGQPDFVSNSVPSPPSRNGMQRPGRVEVDENGRLYVSDGYNWNRLVIFVRAADKANGADADYVLGQPDFTSEGAATTQNRFDMNSSGAGTSVDSVNNILAVADDHNNRVLLFRAGADLRPAELSISKRAPAIICYGGEITYTLTVTNTGLGSADALVVTDTLPSGAGYVSGGSLMPGNVVSWTLPPLAADGGIAQVSFVVTATQAVTNSDYRAVNGQGVEAVSATGSRIVVTRIVYPSLEIAKSGPGTVAANAPITYTLTVTNTGPVSADTLVVTDALPNGAGYVSGGSLMPGNVVSWTLPSLTPDGGTAQLSYVVTANQTITNSDYRVTCSQGISTAGSRTVVTEIEDCSPSVYLPMLCKD